VIYKRFIIILSVKLQKEMYSAKASRCDTHIGQLNSFYTCTETAPTFFHFYHHLSNSCHV